MAELTKEQLIAQAQENVKALKMASVQNAFKDIRPAIELDLHLAEIALAAVTAEPEAYVVGSYSLLHYQNPKLDEYIGNSTPLYRLPLLEGLK